MPGTAHHAIYASFGWMPPRGFHALAELRGTSRVPVNDRNSDAAPGYATASLSAGYVLPLGHWTLSAFARVDNLFDRAYAGSVIVNEGNGRYFEPAPGRNAMVGMRASYLF